MKKNIELTGVNVDLVPAKNWREMSKQGRKSMSFKIFGHAKDESGNLIAVSTVIGALNEAGEIADFGSAEIPAVASLLAKTDSKLDSAKLKYGADGKPLADADGNPVYDENIVQEDGTEFPLAYGTLFFCTLHGGRRFTLIGAELTPSVQGGVQRMAKDAAGNATIPIFDAVADGIKVERRATAQGSSLLGRVKIGVTAGGEAAAAARRATSAAVETVQM